LNQRLVEQGEKADKENQRRDRRIEDAATTGGLPVVEQKIDAIQQTTEAINGKVDVIKDRQVVTPGAP
jgi:hypothetical protein